MKFFAKFAAAAAAVALMGLPAAHARMYEQMFCWTPDAEFPVACEEEDDDEDNNRASRIARPARHGLVPDTIPALVEDQG